MMFGYNVEKIRKDFPSLKGSQIYLDNACMSLKPQKVIDKLAQYYTDYPACAGRSSHMWSERVEHEVEESRKIVKRFLNAKAVEEIVFTRNATEGINIVARGLSFQKGDEVIISDKEHNSNLIPWLRLIKEKGIVLKVNRSNPDNTFSMKNLQENFTKKTKLVSIVHVSNLDGITNPVKDIIKEAHKKGAIVLIDAAQSAPHKIIDVRELDADFLVFSGHKTLGPTGTGVLYGKKDLLGKLTPLNSGGGTVTSSTYESFSEEKLPERLEAGLQDYAGIIGLGAACNYIQQIGFSMIEKHEQRLNKIVSDGLSQEPSIEVIGPKDCKERSSIFSFNIKGIDPLNVARMLSANQIFVRGGMHCVHSWFNSRNMKGSVRASFYIYNTQEEAVKFVEAVKNIIKIIK